MLTSQARVPCCSIFSASMLAYFMGCHIRKAPPKQALKVASGSVTPCSVPATCAEPALYIRDVLFALAFAAVLCFVNEMVVGVRLQTEILLS